MSIPQPVTEMFIDGAWVDVTVQEAVLARDPITIIRGRANEASRVEAAQCSFTLDNRGGRFSPRNPRSPYFSKIGRNTLVRHRIRDARGLLLDGTANSHALTFDAAALDITGDIDLRAEFTLEGSTGTQCLISKGVFGGPQLSYQLLVGFTAGVPHLTLRWSPDGSTTLFVDHEAPIIQLGRIAVRVTLDVDNGTGDHAVMFYAASSIDGPWTELGPAGAAGTGSPTSVFASTSPVFVGRQSTASDLFDGTVYAAEIRNGIDGTVVANPDFAAQAIGTTSFSDAAGRAWTLGTRALIGLGFTSRFIGEIASLPVDWDPSGKDVYTQVEAAGILRRLGQGKAPATSAIRAYLEDTGPDLYLPLDLAAGYPSLDVYQRSSITPGGGDLGTELPPGLRVNTTAGGYLYKWLSQPAAPTEFTIDWLYKAEDLGNLHFTVWLESGGIWDRFQVQLRGNEVEPVNDDVAVVIERDYYNDGAISQVNTDPLEAITDGELHHVRLHLAQDGSGVDVTVYIDGASVLSTTAGFYTLAPARFLSVDYTPTTTNYVSLGHIVAWYDTAPAVVPTANAVRRSRSGETAGRRIERICSQAGIPFTAIGNLDDTAIMGPQGIQSPLEVLHDCAETDLGILFESRDVPGLVYRTRTSLYNQASISPAVELNYEDRVFAKSPKPVDDDQLTRNDVTARNPNGGAYRAVLESGRLSVQDPPNGVGVYDTEATPNVVTDAHLPNQAAWRLHLGTVDEPRYPMLAVALHAREFTLAPELTAAVSRLDVGDLVRIKNLPAWLPPDDVDQLAQGFTETLGTHTRDIEVNCVPASPYDIAVYGSAAGSGPDRYDTAGSELAAAVDSDDTTLLVRSDDTQWTTSVAEFPFDIYVAGERMTVTGITGGGQPAFVGVGAAASSAGGVGVTLAGIGLPAGTQVGDVVLILASIRAPSGFAVKPTGWTEWSHPVGANFNVRMFGRVYDGVWSMPTITYTGGAVGATLLGQSAAFRHVTLSDSLTSALVNSSAQNINQAFSTVNPDQRWGVGIAQAWKQTSWTSVAALPGWTEIGELSSTLGDDAAQAWDYLITRMDTIPATGAEDWIVTGGVAAVSQSNITFLPRASQTFTVVRAVNSITKSHAAGAAVRLWKTPRYGLGGT